MGNFYKPLKYINFLFIAVFCRRPDALLYLFNRRL